MKETIKGIEKADSSEIEDLLKAVVNRYHILFPNWEVSMISLEKCAERNEQLDRMIDILQKMKTSP